MQGENTAKSGPDAKVSPARPGESKAKAARKHALDNSMTLQCLEFLAEVKTICGEGEGDDTVPLSAIVGHDHEDLDASHIVGLITGDASKLAFAFLNPDLGEAVVVAMPERMRIAIQRAGKLPKEDPLHHFLIAIAEHMILPMA